MKLCGVAAYLAAICILVGSSPTFAEPSVSGVQPQISLRGASRQRVIAELGNPDESTDDSLTYGRSKIFLQDDKVVGISGSEELSKRATLNSNISSSQRKSRRDDLRGEWITPWTSQ